MNRPGPTNSILDIPGLSVGHAQDARLKSGVTVVIPDRAAVASVHVMGGAPGTRDTELLSPDETVERVDALVLSGGSAFGLDACGGVQAWLRELGRGFAVGSALVPIVPGAILFDLLNGGNKDWGRFSPYRELGYAAAANASRDPFHPGTIGAGFGATTATLKGGLGSASLQLPSGVVVAALVAVNAVGTVTIGDTPHFWAAPFELEREFGALGLPHPTPSSATDLRLKGQMRVTDPAAMPPSRANTTIAIVATNADLTKAQAKRLSVMAHDGIARAVYPAHTPFDGDLVFSLATGEQPLASAMQFAELGATAANVLARAIARGIHAATTCPNDLLPAWADIAKLRQT